MWLLDRGCVCGWFDGKKSPAIWTLAWVQEAVDWAAAECWLVGWWNAWESFHPADILVLHDLLVQI